MDFVFKFLQKFNQFLYGCFPVFLLKAVKQIKPVPHPVHAFRIMIDLFELAFNVCGSIFKVDIRYLAAFCNFTRYRQVPASP